MSTTTSVQQKDANDDPALGDFRARLDILINKGIPRSHSPSEDTRRVYPTFYTTKASDPAAKSFFAAEEREHDPSFPSKSGPSSIAQFSELDFRMRIHDITETALQEFQDEVVRVRSEGVLLRDCLEHESCLLVKGYSDMKEGHGGGGLQNVALVVLGIMAGVVWCGRSGGGK